MRLAVEAKLLSDVNATSGIQAQSYSTSVLATIRKSLTKLETAGYSPSSLIVHPTDWEGVELALSSTNAVEHLSLPYDPASRRLFGVPVVATVSQAAAAAASRKRIVRGEVHAPVDGGRDERQNLFVGGGPHQRRTGPLRRAARTMACSGRSH